MDQTNWWEIGLSSGVVSGLLIFALNLLKDRWVIRRSGAATALEVALSLENFALGCIEKLEILGDEIDVAHREYSSHALKNVGLLPFEFPVSVQWSALDINLASSIRGFLTKRDGADRKLSSFWLKTDANLLEMADLVYGEMQELAVEALDLAAQARTKYRITAPTFHASDDYDLIKLRAAVFERRIIDAKNRIATDTAGQS